jgi:trans-aconitate methyltransferase
MRKIVRTHDLLYLEEERYEKSKELHEKISQDIIVSRLNHEAGKNRVRILDAGCAAGEFLFLLRKKFPEADIEGFDLLEPLVSKAKLRVKNVKVFEGDILKRETVPLENADVITCTGVLSIFDEFEACLENLLAWAKPGGMVYIHSLFSDHPVDVQIKYSLTEDYGSGVLEAGWNIFSKSTIQTWLTQHKERLQIANYQFIDFAMESDLVPQSDPVRSWTMKNQAGQRLVTNGLCLLQPHAILKIQKS